MFYFLPVALMIVAQVRPAAAWDPSGNRVSSFAVNSSFTENCIRDGSNGTFVAMTSTLPTSHGLSVVFVQHLDGNGESATGWPSGGVYDGTADDDDEANDIVVDGSGGVFYAFIDYGRGLDSVNVFVQHVLKDGRLDPRWPAGGARAGYTRGYKFGAKLATDGTGGVFVLWVDDRTYTVTGDDVYGAHLLPDGSLAPGWTPGGTNLDLSFGDQREVRLFPQSDGALLALWSHDSANVRSLRGTRLLPNGTTDPHWVVGGHDLVSIANPYSGLIGATTDTHGGAIAILSSRTVPLNQPDDYDYFAVHVRPDGTLDPSWLRPGLPGVPIVMGAPLFQAEAKLSSDGLGGVFVCWTDYRGYSFGTGGECYVQRIDSTGTRPPGWPEWGVLAIGGSRDEIGPCVAPDGAGGAYVCGQRDNLAFANTLGQHILANGQVAAGWPPLGRLLIDPPTAIDHYPTCMTEDGRGGAVVFMSFGGQVYAQALVTDGVVATQVSLVSSDVSPAGVHLVWFGDAAPGESFDVERRDASRDWQRIASVSADGQGRIEYLDANVTPGGRFAYRLRFGPASGGRTTAETWIDVPAGFHLAIESRGVIARGTGLVLTLPSTELAHIHVLDVGGRVVASQALDSPSIGRRTVAIAALSDLSSGIYWARLTQGRESTTAKIVVAR